MNRFEFVTEIRSRRYFDGRSMKKRETYFLTIPRELREFLKPGTKVRVVIEILG